MRVDDVEGNCLADDARQIMGCPKEVRVKHSSDGVASLGPDRCCSPRHRQQGFKMRVDDVAGNICSSLIIGRFGEDEARFFFQQLISGLDYCHRQGGAG